MTDDPHRSGDARADRRADYADAYAKAGDPEAAVDLMRQALDLSPGWTLGRIRLAAFMEQAGQTDMAGAVYEAVLAEDEADSYGAGMKLASLGRAPVPDAPPPAFIAGLFDHYADGFETALVDRLGYVVPDAMLSALTTVSGADARFPRTLDLGCGTGLMGERLRPISNVLDGLDLSAGMLDKARRKRIYDGLRQGDANRIEASDDDDRYDLVTAADVLNYLGDLAPLIARVDALLVPGGLFAFSLETHDAGNGFELRPSLRYAHAPDEVAALLADAGLALLLEQRIALRQDRGQPVAGAIMVARKSDLAPSRLALCRVRLGALAAGAPSLTSRP